MTDKNEFSEYYKSVSNVELLQIIDNPKAYQALALDAAKMELERRELSFEEINELRDSNNELASKKIEQNQKIKKAEIVVKNKILSALEVINPIETGIPSTEKKIRFLTIVYTFIFFASLIQSIKLVIYYMDLFSIESIVVCSQLAILPIAIILFWKRRTAGWTLFSVYVIFSIAFIITTSIKWIDAFTSSILLQGIFLVATQIVLCNKDVTETYRITSLNMTSTIVLTFLATFVLTLAI